MAAELEGDSAEMSNVGLHHACGAQILSLDAGRASHRRTDQEDEETRPDSQAASRGPRVYGFRQEAQQSQAARLVFGMR